MPTSMGQLHKQAMETAETVILNGWPKPRWLSHKCQVGSAYGHEQRFLCLKRTGVWLGENGRLYTVFTLNGHRSYKLWVSRSQKRMERVAKALQDLRY